MSQTGNNPKPGGDYERPNRRYRCGRGVAWGKPCSAGPTPNGQCGGVAECQPARRNGQYECRRPASDGGPCAEGPKADGSCSLTHPPCLPRLTLRARRGRTAWQSCVLLALLLAAGFHFGRGAKSRPLAADPGPLSAKHADFTASQGCTACHAAHSAGLGGWLKAAFTHTDMNARCAACHAFAGPADHPHNETAATPAVAPATDCRQCHTEHQGAQAKLTTLTDAQCHACHQIKFHTFDRDHPAFPSPYPRVARAAVNFDHAKHLLEHFKQPEYLGRAQQTCVECHAASPNERNLRRPDFDTACARCHLDQIPQNELVLLRLPEPMTDATRITPDDATPFMAWFLQRAGTNYGAALQQFMAGAAKDGVAPLAKTLDGQGGKNRGAQLLAGLNPELLLRPAQLWLNREKFEPPALKAQSGWYWLEDMYPELHYQPAGHADAVARAWTEFALSAAGGPQDDAGRKRAVQFADEVARAGAGVGRCLKCHAISTAGGGARQVEWNYPAVPERPHTRFSHVAHLGLTRCQDCHALDPQADYAGQFKVLTAPTGVSNFKSIALVNCTGCHAENKVRHDCGLCHEYHRSPSLVEASLKR